jgi:dolichyl-diphosphooligosaccharide--protein glycosyltransferase
MIDDQMAAGKFSAIATWTGDGPGQYFSRQEFQVAGSQAQLVGTNDRYEDTMLAKLYLQDARGLSHYRLVHETGDSAIVSVAQRTPQGFQSTNFINQRLTQSVLTTVQQRQDLFFYNIRQPATVKTFERVPGATLTGQVETDNATTVYATVRLQTNRDRNFTYVQSVQTDGDGRFEVTVPYATTDTVGPEEGGTDSAVEAVGKYELFAGNPIAPSARGNTSVPEPAIYDGETITVEMEAVEQSTGNESAGNGSSDGNESALVFPTGGQQPTASLDAPGGSADAIGAGPTLAEPRRAADV